MKKIPMICLSLVLALGGWSAICAEDGFYVIPSMKVVPKTGQTTSYDTNIPPKDDGALQKGVAWPTPRFTDNNNGTVTDNLTRLIWMKNAHAFGTKTWADALTAANGLKSGDFDLNDGSQAGDWRLPNLRELRASSIMDIMVPPCQIRWEQVSGRRVILSRVYSRLPTGRRLPTQTSPPTPGSCISATAS